MNPGRKKDACTAYCNYLLLLLLIPFSSFYSSAQIAHATGQYKELKNKPASEIIVGAEQTTEYLPLIKDKTIAVVANQTSMIRNTHLVDSLLSLHIKIKCVF